MIHKITIFLFSLIFRQILTEQKTCFLSDYDAPFNDIEKDTLALKKALSDCIDGIIRFNSGKYQLKPFNLTSSQTLFLENGAYLLASPHEIDWPLIAPFPSYGKGKENDGPQYCSFISAWNLNNVKITGEGTGVIDGNGLVWGKRKSKNLLKYTRGRLVEFIGCKNVEISKVNLRYSPFWTLHMYDSENILVEQMNIFNAFVANNDGIDIDSSKNVIIRKVNINTNDDNISIKSGEGIYGKKYNKPSENILIEDSVFEMGAGVAIGSEISGGVRNVLVRNCRYFISQNIVRLKAKLDSCGIAENITYTDLYADAVQIAIYLNENYHAADPLQPLPKYKNVTIKNIHGIAIQKTNIECLKDSPCEDFILENINVFSFMRSKCENVKNNNITPNWCK